MANAFLFVCVAAKWYCDECKKRLRITERR